ncbi:MAG TPA: hypothetical protein VEI97_14695 [bacterium]|nr:hypothetical protein [bacterium]
MRRMPVALFLVIISSVATLQLLASQPPKPPALEVAPSNPTPSVVAKEDPCVKPSLAVDGGILVGALLNVCDADVILDLDKSYLVDRHSVTYQLRQGSTLRMNLLAPSAPIVVPGGAATLVSLVIVSGEPRSLDASLIPARVKLQFQERPPVDISILVDDAAQAAFDAEVARVKAANEQAMADHRLALAEHERRVAQQKEADTKLVKKFLLAVGVGCLSLLLLGGLIDMAG